MSNKVMPSGIIINKTKGFYQVYDQESKSTLTCKVKNSRFKNSKYDRQLVVGDRVCWQAAASSGGEQEEGLIVEAEERETFFARKRTHISATQVITANASHLCIVAALNEPDFHENLVLRMAVAAYAGGMQPQLIISKTDTDKRADAPGKSGGGDLQGIIADFTRVGVNTLPFSIFDPPQKREALHDLVRGHSTVFAGESGVGKSSLINLLLPELSLRTLSVSDRFKTGRHTTTAAQIYFGGDSTLLIDTPGVREFHFADMQAGELAQYFPGVRDHRGNCHYKDCLHLHEPKCGVKAAAAEGEIPAMIYTNYSKICLDLQTR